MVAGAQDFVWFHEYAHLLLGHLVVGSCPEVENEADLFASTIIAELSRWNGFFSVGMVVMLMILVLMETQKGTPVTRTHPIAGIRLLTALSPFEESERLVLRELVDAVQSALGPVLRQLGYGSFVILL